MATHEIAITYEVLFELLRREKNRDELQELSPALYQDLERYVQEKTQVKARFQQAGNASEADRVAVQITNTERLFAELTERREKKILMLAIYQSKTRHAQIQTKNMLSPEKELFSKVLALLKESREAIQASRHALPADSAAMSQGEASPVEGYPPKDRDESEEGEEVSSSPSIKKVLMLTDVASFVGPDLDPLGPFSAGQEVSLDRTVADMLITKKQAKSVEE